MSFDLILPFFRPMDGSDAGFDPIDHTQVDSRLGTWDDVLALSENLEIMSDLIVNHVSSQSPQFQDFIQRGEKSPYAGMFLTYKRVFPEGADESDLLQIVENALGGIWEKSVSKREGRRDAMLI